MGSYPSSSRGFSNPYLPQQQTDQYSYYYPEAYGPTSWSGVYPPPPPLAPHPRQQGYYQGYFDDLDVYPPQYQASSSSQQQYYHDYGDGSSFLSFLQGCMAAFCCCWLFERCSY